MLLLNLSCLGFGPLTYNKSDVREVVLSENLLQLRVMPETLFYLAGADVVSHTDDMVTLKLIRCKYNKSCKTDIPSKFDRDTGYRELTLDAKRVRLDFGKEGFVDVVDADK